MLTLWYKKETNILPGCTVSVSIERQYSAGKEKETILATDALLEKCFAAVARAQEATPTTKIEPEPTPVPEKAEKAETPAPPEKAETPAPKKPAPAAAATKKKATRKRGRPKKPAESPAPVRLQACQFPPPTTPETPAADTAELRKRILEKFALHTEEAKALLAERNAAMKATDVVNTKRYNQEISKKFVIPFLSHTLNLTQADFKNLDHGELETIHNALNAHTEE